MSGIRPVSFYQITVNDLTTIEKIVIVISLAIYYFLLMNEMKHATNNWAHVFFIKQTET